MMAHSQPQSRATGLHAQSIPLPVRVQQLEQQRYELATALAGTQDGYEALYRDLVDSRRREDALVQIVEELYGVVQRNFSGQCEYAHPPQLTSSLAAKRTHMPYQFPAHVFAPKGIEEQPVISVTHADPSHSRPHPHQRGPSLQYAPTPLDGSYSQAVYDQYSTFEPPQSSPSDPTGAASPFAQGSLYHPQPQRHQPNPLDSGYYGSPQQRTTQMAMPGNQTLAGAMLNPHSQNTTLAPPPSPGSAFNNAVNTPLPTSPLPGSSQQAAQNSSARNHGLVGLGLASEDGLTTSSLEDPSGTGRYYERLGLSEPHDDVEMSLSSLAAFAGDNGATSRDPNARNAGYEVGGGGGGGPGRSREQRVEGSGDYATQFLKREDEMSSFMAGSEGMRMAVA
ncbi:hypothetical protein P7C70_g6320, partial [Phenoliferia sp. Uapishka_3]